MSIELDPEIISALLTTSQDVAVDIDPEYQDDAVAIAEACFGLIDMWHRQAYEKLGLVFQKHGYEKTLRECAKHVNTY